jgi:isopenicillin N synthase-like dioxygenase
VRAYYLGMERVAAMIMRALARGLGVAEDLFAQAFSGGLSTLRLMRYPLRSPQAAAMVAEDELYVTEGARRRMLSSEAHVDFGFMTLLAQHGVAGLQARMPNGEWIDIPPRHEALTVNFGKLLERWSGRRIRATAHRVLSLGCERFSIPFFYEPRADARIAPLPGVEPFEPFLYGDHVWASQPRLRRFFGDRAAKLDQRS